MPSSRWNTIDRGSDYAASELDREESLSYVGQVGGFQVYAGN
jgi:hypothetical protein